MMMMMKSIISQSIRSLSGLEVEPENIDPEGFLIVTNIVVFVIDL